MSLQAQRMPATARPAPASSTGHAVRSARAPTLPLTRSRDGRLAFALEVKGFWRACVIGPGFQEGCPAWWQRGGRSGVGAWSAGWSDAVERQAFVCAMGVARQAFWQGPLLAGLTWQGV